MIGVGVRHAFEQAAGQENHVHSLCRGNGRTQHSVLLYAAKQRRIYLHIVASGAYQHLHRSGQSAGMEHVRRCGRLFLLQTRHGFYRPYFLFRLNGPRSSEAPSPVRPCCCCSAFSVFSPISATQTPDAIFGMKLAMSYIPAAIVIADSWPDGAVSAYHQAYRGVQEFRYGKAMINH